MSRHSLVLGLLLAAAVATLLLGFSPPPAGPRGSIDFEPSACGRWLAIGVALRGLWGLVLLAGAGATFIALRRRAPLRVVAAVVAVVLATAGAGLRALADEAPPWPSFEELCRSRPP